MLSYIMLGFVILYYATLHGIVFYHITTKHIIFIMLYYCITLLLYI